jgi:ABC-type Na+ efflux pump permease subunit
MKEEPWPAHLRIVGAIAAKDTIDAIRNKTIQGLMLGILMMMLTGRALPLLAGLSGDKTLIIYDRGQSRSILERRKQEDVRLGRAESQAEMQDMLGTAADVRLGLVLPADFDQRIESGQPLELTAYAVHWAKQSEIDELTAFWEQTLTELAGQPVALTVDAERVYPPVDGQGFTSLAMGTIVLVTITVGIFLVPYLIGEERQSKTMDALLVSPASTGQIVAGKAIAGSVYCLATAAIAIAFNANLFVHWGVVVLTIACGTLFAVGAGLLLGALFELPQHITALAGMLLAVLIVPVYVADSTTLPPILRAILSRLPSTALNAALKISLARAVPSDALWANLGSVLIVSALIYGATIWRIRRADR